ncbi:MAG: hypothetical protein JNL82_14655 [Myxococcales bacterium]|nr:hypothetical protein [Myxococcales bacterium]
MRHIGLAVGMMSLGGCGLFGFGGGDDGSGDGGSGDADASWSGGASRPTDGGHDGGHDGGYTEPATTGIEMTGADNMLPDDEMCPCVADNEDIYLLSDNGSIWSFDPQSLEFDFIKDVVCGGMTDTFSMGVSRKGRAWVQYFSGDIYTVDLKDPDAECLDPGFVNDDPLFPNFGMAFVANSITDPCDKLYAHSGIGPDVIGPGSGALGVIDPKTLALSQIAAIDYGWGELAGTGDGRLFAFEGSAPPILTQYDKDSGAVLDAWPLPSLPSPDAFAFAYWGGFFYLFTEPSPPTGYSMVTRYDFYDLDGEGMVLSTIVDQAPIRVVGAGVSTCAPPDPQ